MVSTLIDNYPLDKRVRELNVPEGSNLIGLTLNESRLGNAVDIQILCIVRQNGTTLVPTSTDCFEPGDRLVVSGSSDMLSILLMQGLEGVFIQEQSQPLGPSMLENEQVGLVDVMLSPHSVLSGITLREMNFREKYVV